MLTERLEVRLGRERRRRLEELAEAEGAPVSEVIRRLIDAAYEEALQERRREAVRRIASMEAEDVPDSETLKRQLESAHDPDGVP